MKILHLFLCFEFACHYYFDVSINRETICAKNKNLEACLLKYRLNSKSALGRDMTSEQKEKMKLELKQLKMEDISSFLESLPPDFLAILRTE